MARKIIHIAYSESFDGYSKEKSGALYALCDDGSIWVKAFGSKTWVRIEDVPQK